MMQSENDGFLFAEDDGAHQEEETSPQTSGVWDLLIVDDDPEIHSVTKLALNGFVFQERSLVFHDAYSGEEAINYLKSHPEISVILLDVVMESDDAGLKVVKRLREELENNQTRIILRTGQPGQAPEEHVIREYDINDYKTKTELTRSKLVTSLITALRSHKQLDTLAYYATSLEEIIEASKQILGITETASFGHEVINQFLKLIGADGDGVFCGAFKGDDTLTILGGSETFYPEIGKRLEHIDNGRVIHQVSQCVSQQAHQQTEYDITFFVKGQTRHAAIFLETERTFDDAQMRFIEIFLTNISVGFENVCLFNSLKEAAYKDALTGLPNRTDFVEQIQRFAAMEGAKHRLFLIDIDQFSDVNNGLGQEVGNLLLEAVVTRLKDDVTNPVLMARIGADVFALLVEKGTVDIEDLNSILSHPFRVEDNSIQVNFSIGICDEEFFHLSGLQTLKAAYIALNLAKQADQQNYEYYQPEMEQQVAWRLGIIRQLRHDFAEERLQVWYQPQIDLRSGELIGCEALLRWPSSDGGFISPGVFVPLAEDCGLIVDIGRWVLDEACKKQRNLAAKGVDIRIAVNVSVPQFRNPNFVDEVFATIEKYQIDPKRIELEVTESIVMDEQSVVINALNRLRDYGIEIAIDDFGTGFSSLSYLQKLPLNRIKIDRAFIKDIPKPGAEAIAELIIELGSRLKLHTIAEGIETQEQADYLVAAGCQEAQGFMYSKPLPPDELHEFVQSYQAKPNG